MRNLYQCAILFAILLLFGGRAQAGALDVTVSYDHPLYEVLDQKTSDYESVTQLTVHGPMYDNDLSVLQDLTNLEVLDLSDAQVETFSYCTYLTKLRKIVLGESTTKMESGACMLCSALTEVTMPAIEELGYSAFYGCTALKTIDLPSTLNLVGTNVFEGCTALKDIYCYAADYQGTLFTEEAKGITLHVHKNLVNFFKAKEAYAGVTIVGMDFMFSQLLLTRPTTLKDISAYQGADVNFKAGEIIDSETFSVQYSMGALNLDAPASPKWQVGKLTLPVDYYSYQTNYNSEDYEQSKDVYAVASFVNQRTQAEAQAIEVKVKGVEDGMWTFFSVPFDVNVSDIRCTRGTWTICRYVGEKRAAVKVGETWEVLKAGEQLHAFEGYLFKIETQGRDDEDYEELPDDYTLILPAADTKNKQNVFAAGDVIVPLKKFPADRPHNADWNLVGNPYPCYFELSSIKEHVDVYFFKNSDEGYVSVNTADGKGIFLAPNMTFFVQATNVSQLTFQASGRLLEAPFGELDPATKPIDPGANYFNNATQEAYFDFFEPGTLNEAEYALLKEGGAERVKILTVAAPMNERDLYFTGYTNVVRIDLGQSGGFSKIPSWCFAYLTTLKELVLPASITSINDEAFLMSTALEELTVYATTPPTITSKVFHSLNKEDLVVLVPKDAVAAYKAADGWKDLNIQPIGGGGEELQSVSICIRTSEGQDLTSQCNILWRDADGNLLGVGHLIEAQAVGSKITYSVTLPIALASRYEVVPEGTVTIRSSGNDIAITLIATDVIDLGSRTLVGSLATMDFSLEVADKSTTTALEINDVQLTLTDKQSGSELTDFLLQYPELRFEQTTLEPGQIIHVRAASRSNSFVPTETDVVTDANGDLNIVLTLKEYGHADIMYTRSDGAGSKAAATIFAADGHYVARYLSNGNHIIVKDLPDGTYTAVVMAESQFFSTVASLNDLDQTLLREGADYARLTIQLVAATTKTYEVEVPALDESRLCHTSSESYITTNDLALAVTNTATLKAKVVFKPEYAAVVSNLRLIITFPEGTGYVDNSLLMTQSDGSHQYANQRLIVPCQAGEQVRFCLDATTAGVKAVSAMVQYNLNGKQYTQPIGAANIEVQNPSLDLCEITDTPTITVEGYLTPKSHVIIYDGTTKLAEFNANIIGEFKTEITLNPAYNGTYHNIYATFQNGNTIRTTETSTVLLDNSASILTEISMIYQDQCVTWHTLAGSLMPDYYSVNPTMSSVATFIAKLNNPQPQNILGPEFYVIASDGTERVIPATWDEAQQVYTATSEYPGDKRLPAQVFFIYDYANATPPEREDIFEAEVNYIQSLHNRLVTDVDELVNFVEIIKDEEDEVVVDFTIGNSPTRFRLTMKMEDYATFEALRESEPFTHTRLATDSIAYSVDGDETYITVRCIDFTNHYAYSTSIRYADASSSARRVPRRISLPKIPSSLLGKTKFVSDLAGLIDEVKGYVQDGLDLMWSKVYLDQMKQTRDNHQRSLAFQIGNCQFLLWAMCSNNTYRVPSGLFQSFQAQITAAENQNETFIKQLDGLIDAYLTALRNRVGQEYVGAILGAGAGKLVKVGLSKGLKVLHNVAKTGLGTFAEVTGLVKDGAKNGIKNIGTEAFKNAFPTDFMGVKNYFEKFAPEGWTRCAERNMAIADAIVASYKKCEEDPGEIQRPRRKRKGGKRSRPIIDPSGFVYEGVVSNRIEGVTATLYYKENANATEELWNAEEFGQTNPQTTDAAGLYMWNVPQGLWQVRFEKDGYQSTQTDWLPVPPPQLEIAVAMTPTDAPVVKDATAYADAVSIRFSQYMQLASLSDINVKQNGTVVQGSLEPTDADGDLVRTLRFLPTQKLTAKTVQLTVPVTAKSHNGSTLADVYTATLDVQHTIEGLLVQEGVVVQLANVGYVTVTAYPAIAVAGKELSVTCNSPIVELGEELVVFDENGQALVPFYGILPGEVDAIFAIGDLKASATVAVKRYLLERCGRPVATIAEGPVAAGTKVELISSTEGAVIYYTTDGSCPCDELTRQRYTDPITITDGMTLQAIAVHDGMTDSEVTTLNFTIATGIMEPKAEETVEAEEFFYDLRGQRQLPPLRRGIYIHVCRTPTGTSSRKVRVN